MATGDSQPSTPLKLEDWKSVLIRWAIQQSFPAVMLLVQTGVIMYMGWYAINTAIPQHLRSIQDGYDKQEAVHQKIINDVVASAEKEREFYRTVFMSMMNDMKSYKENRSGS